MSTFPKLGMVTCIFNFMNRLLEGHGVKGNEKIFKIRGKMLKEHGYRYTIQNPMN